MKESRKACISCLLKEKPIGGRTVVVKEACDTLTDKGGMGKTCRMFGFGKLGTRLL